jgi:hypothetical protein
MSSDPKDSGMGELQGLLQAMIYSDPSLPASHRLGGMQIQQGSVPTTEGLNALTKQYYGTAESNLAGDRSRSMTGAGQLASARGYSQGLSNPFALAQRAEQGVYGEYANQMGGLQTSLAQQMMQNPLTSFNADAKSRQYNNDLLMQMLGMKGGFTSQRSGNPWMDVGGALVSGAGQIAAAL